MYDNDDDLATNVRKLPILYGVPLGLAAAMPLLIQGDSTSSSYAYQAIFSWVFWPFSLKLLWAPFVDSIYFKKFGRRKSWLIPIQYIIGLWMIALSYVIDDWFGRPPDDPWGVIGSHGPLKINLVTFGFFILTFFASTQDIVVDGENVAWASTCNTVGQVTGHIIAFLVFLSLESAETSNKYFRSKSVPNQGIVSTNGFLYFWGIIFIVSTSVIAILKTESNRRRKDQDPFFSKSSIGIKKSSIQRKRPNQSTDSEKPIEFFDNLNPSIDPLNKPEVNHENDKSMNRLEINEEPELGLFETYRIMKGVLFLRPIMLYIAVQFFIKIPFSPGETIFALKAIENGISKDKLVFFGVLLLPLQITLPLIITKWTTGPNPMSIFSASILPRIIFGTLTIPLSMYISGFRHTLYDHSKITFPEIFSANITDSKDLALLQTLQKNNHLFTSIEKSIQYDFPYSFYLIFFVQSIFYAIFQNSMFVSQMAFHAKISDPQIGGTYMTLLNTATNMAANLPSTIALYMVDPLTWRKCENPNVILAGLASIGIKSTPSEIENIRFDESTYKFIRKAGEIYIQNSTDCKPMNGIEACEAAGGSCHVTVDGFYFEVIVCLIFGIIGYFAFIKRSLKYLDSLPVTAFYYRTPSHDHASNSKSRKRLSSAD